MDTKNFGKQIKEFHKRKKEILARAIVATSAGAWKLVEAIEEVIPIDTEFLKKGVIVRELIQKQNFVGYVVAYTAPYAIFVHEDLTKVHGAAFNIKYAAEIANGTTHARRDQEKAKFMSDTIVDPNVQRRIKYAIRKQMKGNS